VVIAALILVCAIFVFSYSGRMVRKAELEAEAVRWEALIADARQKQHVLTAERTQVESDAYVDKVARDELGLGKEDDVEIIVIEPTLTPASVTSNTPADGTYAGAADASRGSMPVWQQWMSLLASGQ
jgi:hypothetical protein